MFQTAGPSNASFGQNRPDEQISAHDAARSAQDFLQHSMSHASTFNVDPFRHELLCKTTVDFVLRAEAIKIFKTPDEMREQSTAFFNSAWLRLPIVCKSLFLERLPTMYSAPKADFILLCLCIHLVMQQPQEIDESMRSTLYILIRSQLNLLEVTGFLTLELVQAQLIVLFYEFGHGIHPSASVHIATCARTARLLGLNKKMFRRIQDSDAPEFQMRAEAEKRTWWAVINFDR